MSWRDRPKYKYWSLKEVSEHVLSVGEVLFSLLDTSLKIDKDVAHLELSFATNKKCLFKDFSLSVEITLQFSYGGSQELIKAGVGHQFTLILGGKLLVLKSLSVEPILYRYGSALWPHRYQRNLFGGGRQFYMLVDKNNYAEFFITMGDMGLTSTILIDNISEIV